MLSQPLPQILPKMTPAQEALIARNKEQARAHLLAISLILARKPM